MEELKKRKTPRLQGFDYSEVGVYFVTVCTQNRKNILSKIVGEGSPLPQLSPSGEIVDALINEIDKKYQGVCVDSYVIMPNHIHILLSVIEKDGRGNPSPTLISVIGWLKYQATKEINVIRKTGGEKVFQRSFYDHIIRNSRDYEEHLRYIYENPIRWQYDELYTE